MPYTLKKSLGQHFLKDENVCRKIVSVLMQHSFKRLLEIGPGGGALTKFILNLEGVDFRAIELDAEKIEYLLRTYPLLEGKLMHEDFLKASVPFDAEFTIIGNFPYNISSQILFKILEWKDKIPVVIGMFQKEVAQRITSKPNSKNYGILSVLVQTFYDARYLFDVPASCFVPPPKVMSGVIELSTRKQPALISSEKDLYMLVKTAFNQRRKKLRNAVRSLFGKDMLENPIFDKRAEQLSIDDFAGLTFNMNKV